MADMLKVQRLSDMQISSDEKRRCEIGDEVY